MVKEQLVIWFQEYVDLLLTIFSLHCFGLHDKAVSQHEFSFLVRNNQENNLQPQADIKYTGLQLT